MAIYEYDGSDKAPSGYLGVRVSVSVNGTVRQKWFNYRKQGQEIPKMEQEALLFAAKRTEREWQLEQMLHSEQRTRQRVEGHQNCAYKTGVAGIKMKFAVHKKTRGTKKYCHYSPVFIVAGTHEKTRIRKTFSIKKYGYDMAWFKACSFTAEQYGFSSYDHLLKRKPPIHQFEIIYRWQNSQGHTIPLERLPDELLETLDQTRVKERLVAEPA